MKQKSYLKNNKHPSNQATVNMPHYCILNSSNYVPIFFLFYDTKLRATNFVFKLLVKLRWKFAFLVHPNAKPPLFSYNFETKITIFNSFSFKSCSYIVVVKYLRSFLSCCSAVRFSMCYSRMMEALIWTGSLILGGFFNTAGK